MKRILLLILVFLILGSVWFVWGRSKPSVLSAKEKNAALAKILNRDPVLENKKIASWQAYQGKYIHFSYPADAVLQQNQTKQANVLESVNLNLPATHLTLAVQVLNVSLNDYPGLTLRRNNKEHYQAEKGKVGDFNSLIFTKKVEGAEKIAFVEANSKLFTIAVSGYNGDDVAAFYTKFIASIVF